MSDRRNSSEGGRKFKGKKDQDGKPLPVTVPVPPGCKAGDKIKLSVYGQKVSAYIPEGIQEGQNTFKIMPPEKRDPEQESEKVQITVTVPDGTSAGNMMTFTVGEGSKAKKLTVIVPKGLKSGDPLTVTLFSDYDKPSRRDKKDRNK